MLDECPSCWLSASGNLHRGRAKGVALMRPPPWLADALHAVVDAAGGSMPRLFATARLGGSVALALAPRTIVVATDELNELTAHFDCFIDHAATGDVADLAAAAQQASRRYDTRSNR